MKPETKEQLKWWRLGVLAQLAENAKQYATCKGAPNDPNACKNFDCLGCSITTDQYFRINKGKWPDPIGTIPEIFKGINL